MSVLQSELQLLTADQVAKILSMSPRWVRGQAGREGGIPCVRLAENKLRFEHADVLEFIAARKQGRAA